MHSVLSMALLAVIPSVSHAVQSAAPSSKSVEERVESILGGMTTAEKIDLLGGVDGFYVRGVPRLGVPRLRMADGPMGVRNDGPATAFGGGIGLAATWNPELVERVGVQLGRDARAKGARFLLAPAVNIYRAPQCGRNFEYFGEDPLLAARTAVAYIKGVQSQGVCATVKHFAGNNSEFDRNHTDSVIDERTLREIYLPAFEAAVKEGHVGAIMDSYNLTNGVYMSQNAHLNSEVAKGGWGFDGLIMSDWVSTYDGVGAANGGLDLEMPSGEHLNRETLLPAIQAGKVTMATIDDKVRRILRTAVKFGWLESDVPDLSISRYNTQGRDAALDAARESVVLLKNEGSLLPFDARGVRSILVVGPDAHPAVTGGGGSSQVQPFSSVSILEGLAEVAGEKVQVFYDRGLPTLGEMVGATRFSTAATGGVPGMRVQYFANAEVDGMPAIERVEPRVEIGSQAYPEYPEGTLSDRWTGFYAVPSAGDYDFFVAAAGDGGGYYRLSVDDKLALDSWDVNKALVDYVTLPLDAGAHKVVLEQHGRQKWPGARLQLGISRHGDRVAATAKALAARVDAVVVAAGFDGGTESEGLDRTFRLPPGQDELIKAMAMANKNTAVVITAGGAVDTRPWLDSVPALLHVWYPGQEGGTAIGEVLMGVVNPSGRLPATFERRWEDNPVHDSYYPEAGTRRVAYKEGVFVGYRGYEKNGVQPQFPFGYGLSYTTFKYANLKISPVKTRDGSAEVTFDVSNTGNREGADVAQVYVAEMHSKVPRPPKELKGFIKVKLRPGETRRVSVSLDRRALSYYDVGAKQWRADPGEFGVLVGRSSADIVLEGTLKLTK
jgi:beta-glucosidase